MQENTLCFIPGRWAVCFQVFLDFPWRFIHATSMILQDYSDKPAETRCIIIKKTNKTSIEWSSVCWEWLFYVHIWNKAFCSAFSSLLRISRAYTHPHTHTHSKCQKHTLSKRTFSCFSITDHRHLLHLLHVNTACLFVHICASYTVYILWVYVCM